MNLTKLFEIQKVLRDRIGYNEPDRLNKLILALLVELGECANEWRGFKFWSVNQIPHTSAVRVPCMMEEDKEYYNPLLEEYVDGLHFVLELGLEDYEVYGALLPIKKYGLETSPIKYNNVIEQFNYLYMTIGYFMDCATNHEVGYPSEVEDQYENIFRMYVGLGEMLGFTWEQIEAAYMEKNAINHQRQDVGY